MHFLLPSRNLLLYLYLNDNSTIDSSKKNIKQLDNKIKKIRGVAQIAKALRVLNKICSGLACPVEAFADGLWHLLCFIRLFF